MKRNDPDKIGKVPNIKGVERLTATTGVVRGVDNIQSFISECKSTFDNVEIIDMEFKVDGYLQYTLLTNNRILLFN